MNVSSRSLNLLIDRLRFMADEMRVARCRWLRRSERSNGHLLRDEREARPSKRAATRRLRVEIHYMENSGT